MSLINDALKRAKQTHQARQALTPESSPKMTLQAVEASDRRVRSWNITLLAAAFVAVVAAIWFFFYALWPQPAGRPPASATPTHAQAPTPSEAISSSSLTDRETSATPLKQASSVKVSTSLVTRGGAPMTTSHAPTAGRDAPPAARTPETPVLPVPAASKEPPFVRPAQESTSPPRPLSGNAPALAPALTQSTTDTIPVTPPSTPAPPAPTSTPIGWDDLRLQGIFYRLNKPSAVLNGLTVFVGDQIGEARVRKIERMSVTVELQGQIKVLQLGRP
jgi:cytoskeletal protein RodZ